MAGSNDKLFVHSIPRVLVVHSLTLWKIGSATAIRRQILPEVIEWLNMFSYSFNSLTVMALPVFHIHSVMCLSSRLCQIENFRQNNTSSYRMAERREVKRRRKRNKPNWRCGIKYGTCICDMHRCAYVTIQLIHNLFSTSSKSSSPCSAMCGVCDVGGGVYRNGFHFVTSSHLSTFDGIKIGFRSVIELRPSKQPSIEWHCAATQNQYQRRCGMTQSTLLFLESRRGNGKLCHCFQFGIDFSIGSLVAQSNRIESNVCVCALALCCAWCASVS